MEAICMEGVIPPVCLNVFYKRAGSWGLLEFMSGVAHNHLWQSDGQAQLLSLSRRQTGERGGREELQHSVISDTVHRIEGVVQSVEGICIAWPLGREVFQGMVNVLDANMGNLPPQFASQKPASFVPPIEALL